MGVTNSGGGIRGMNFSNTNVHLHNRHFGKTPSVLPANLNDISIGGSNSRNKSGGKGRLSVGLDDGAVGVARHPLSSVSTPHVSSVRPVSSAAVMVGVNNSNKSGVSKEKNVSLIPRVSGMD
jgi:hypothetical protein